MPTFQYEAVDKRGQAVSGSETAKSVPVLADKLRRAGFAVIDIREERSLIANALDRLGFSERLPLAAIMIMMRQFATLIKASVPLTTALDVLSRQGLNRKMDRALHQIQKDVRVGKSLSNAFESCGSLFPALTVPLIRAGEISGQLDEMLERYASHLEKEVALVRSWRQASVYPATIFIVSCLLVLGLVTHIFPIFISMFKGLDVELPVATRALITITETSRNPIVVIPAVLALLVGSYLLYLHFRSPVGRRQWDSLRLEVPYLGVMAKKVAFARIARTLGLLLSSGVPYVTSLEVAGTIAGNSVVKDALDRIVQEMKGGARFSERLHNSDLFPRVFVQMVEAGEESGDLPAQLARVGDFFEDEVLLALATFTSLLEPVMIVVMGAVVFFILVAVFQPVYQLMSLF